MYKGLKPALLIVLYIIQFQITDAQVGRNNLKPLLSSSDQKAIEKIEVVFNKGKNIENEANIISSSGSTDKENAKNEKKYTLKRLEASQHYQKANADLISLFKDNINKFWKENKNSKIDPSIKNNEDKANELTRNAKALRKVAEDLTYPSEKLSKLIEAESIELDAINIFTKVLYAYLNYPISYDSLNKEKTAITEIAKTDTVKAAEQSSPVSYLPVEPVTKKDTLVIQEPVKTDTIPQIQPEPIPVKQEPVKTPLSEPTDVLATKQLAPKDTGSLYNMMEVKEEQVDKFNKFLEDSYPDKFENYVINFRELNYNDFDSIRSSWTRYNQYQFSPEEIASLKKSRKDTAMFAAVSPDSSKAEELLAVEPDTGKKDTLEIQEVISEKTAVTKKQPAKKNQKTTGKTPPKETVISAVESADLPKTNTSEYAKGFIYRVQISACRIPVDEKSLKNIYGGNMKILELNEDNWYKYAIGEFNTYGEARHLRDAVKIPGAFVIAYLNGKRIQILDSNVSTSAYNYKDIENLIYKVQIAAAKTPLDKKYLSHIYAGNENIEENLEDGWYKYSIVIGPSLASTKKFIETENIPGAFITSYLRGKKIELKEALKISKIKKQ